MNIFQIISAIIAVIKLAPEVRQLVQEIIALINSFKGSATVDHAALAERFMEAIKEVREAKSTKKLEALQKELSGICASTGTCGVQQQPTSP